MKRYMKRNEGFTLMELLIVIAIIVVLVSISIPVFKGQITKANETADIASIRTCYAEQQDEILTSGKSVEEAIDAIEALELNYQDKLSVSDDGIISYTPTIVNNNAGFTWSFKDSSI